MAYPLVRIKRGKEQSILRKHPWVFSGAIHSISEDLEEGALVAVCNSDEEILGVGHFAMGSIAVRILSFENSTLNAVFFESRLRKAWQKRQTVKLVNHSETNLFRWVHAEGDELPGLIIDWYNGVAVIQCHSIGMFKQLPLISKAIQAILGSSLKAIYNKSKETIPTPYKATCENGYVFEQVTTPHQAKENGHVFNIDWVNGQKTGFFIDQRDNRAYLAQLAKDKKILNTFCYSGGFSIYALNAGAKEVHSLDSSASAIQLVEDNIAQNPTPGLHKSFVANALDFLKDDATPNDYDIIVLDPPAFAKSIKNKHKAVQGYKRLNKLGLNKIKSGGLLFTFSCSQVIDLPLFINTLRAAAIESKRSISILNILHQASDHPINLYHPESEYLKGLVLIVN